MVVPCNRIWCSPFFHYYIQLPLRRLFVRSPARHILTFELCKDKNLEPEPYLGPAAGLRSATQFSILPCPDYAPKPSLISAKPLLNMFAASVERWRGKSPTRFLCLHLRHFQICRYLRGNSARLYKLPCNCFLWNWNWERFNELSLWFGKTSRYCHKSPRFWFLW